MASVVTMNTATKYERFVIFIVTFLNIVDENSLYSLMQRSISLNFRRLTEQIKWQLLDTTVAYCWLRQHCVRSVTYKVAQKVRPFASITSVKWPYWFLWLICVIYVILARFRCVLFCQLYFLSIVQNKVVPSDEWELSDVVLEASRRPETKFYGLGIGLGLKVPCLGLDSWHFWRHPQTYTR